ncbi:MAG: class I SAM-dependent methyltransferase [Xenococcaceae cyanobacterium]
MTRRIKRQKDFEISLQIKHDNFIRPPREAQRNWLLNRALKEFADDLMHLDSSSKRFIRGTDQMGFEDRTQKVLEDHDIMEDWQIPVMKAMADIVTETHGEVLEIGFGRGVASTYIQDLGVQSHTIVECNDSVVERFHPWRQQYPDRDIRLVHGKWQDVVDQLDQYDGIFFHTYPLNQEEYLAYVVQSMTFAEHFFPTTAGLLREGGIFTYLTNETDSLSRAHQRLVFRYFTSFTLSIIEPLAIPSDSRDALWADSMVVIKAVK